MPNATGPTWQHAAQGAWTGGHSTLNAHGTAPRNKNIAGSTVVALAGNEHESFQVSTCKHECTRTKFSCHSHVNYLRVCYAPTPTHPPAHTRPHMHTRVYLYAFYRLCCGQRSIQRSPSISVPWAQALKCVGSKLDLCTSLRSSTTVREVLGGGQTRAFAFREPLPSAVQRHRCGSL